ncbi:MAG: hypothetical protein K2Q01_00235 [Rickettsiales bacterium]|nr:hypothetical protein [Rickettsiales bacterium]
MTNCYNAFFTEVENALGVKRLEQTNPFLAKMHALETPDEILRKLLQSQEAVVQWREEAQLQGEEGKKELEKISKAAELGSQMISPLLTKESRSGGLTGTGGNFVAALLDLWVQQDFVDAGNHPPRQAHIVQYDMINMEAIMRATERMIGAADRLDSKRSARKRTTTSQFTDGYMRIVNGIVKETFEKKLLDKNEGVTKANVGAHVQLIRLSSGDEFRIAVAGLSDDEVKECMQAAQKEVQVFVGNLGFDSLPHLKYLKDDQPWYDIGTREQLKDPHIFNAMKFGGAGIKIGAVALGEGRTTDGIINELDAQMNENRMERANAREVRIRTALDQGKPPFVNGHKDEAKFTELGTVRYNHGDTFKYIIRRAREGKYRDMYRRPDPDRRNFPFNLADERMSAYPANNPEHYTENLVDIINSYVQLSDVAKPRLTRMLQQAFAELPPAGMKQRAPQDVTAVVMHAVEGVLAQAPSSKEGSGITLTLERSIALEAHLKEFLGKLNHYECFDVTRKRLLDKEADKIGLSREQREALIYKPLAFFNARDKNGVCMNGQTKEAVELFQAHDGETRLLTYIGLSSFAGTNEVATSLGKRINEQVREIAAEELTKRFGKNVLDFAFVVDSGRMHLLTHGISKEQLVEALSAIEIRVDKDINQQPIGVLFDRYRTFSKHNLTKKVTRALEENSRQAEEILATVREAREAHGDKAFLFWVDDHGQTQYKVLEGDAVTPEMGAAMAGGKKLFFEESIPAKAPIPDRVKEHLIANGYAKANGSAEPDLNLPLALLPNPKFTHEKGVRVITGHVELLGREPALANQSKNFLMKLIEAKKLIAYKPGEGHLVQLPAESVPHYTTKAGAKGAVTPHMVEAAGALFGRTSRLEPKKKDAVTPKPTLPEAPSYQPPATTMDAWFKRLDEEEFSRLHKRQVPYTLLQLIADPSVQVVKERDDVYKINVERSPPRYGRQTITEHAVFIKYALNEYFGASVKVTGVNPDAKKRDHIALHVCRSEAPGPHLVKPGDRDLVTFMDDLAAFKARPLIDQKVAPNGIKGVLKVQDSQYQAEVRAIRLLRQYPTLQVERDLRHARYVFVIPPASEGERQKVRRQRASELFAALKLIFSEKAQMEELPPPLATFPGAGTSRIKEKYDIRIKETPVSKHVLQLMEDLQYRGEGEAKAVGVQ